MLCCGSCTSTGIRYHIHLSHYACADPDGGNCLFDNGIDALFTIKVLAIVNDGILSKLARIRLYGI